MHYVDLDDAADDAERAADAAGRDVVAAARRIQSALIEIDADRPADLSAAFADHTAALARWEEAIAARNAVWSARRAARRSTCGGEPPMIHAECGGHIATAHDNPRISIAQTGGGISVVLEAGSGRDAITVALDLDTLLTAAVETARLGGPGVARLVSSRLLRVADHLGPPPERPNVVALR